MTDEEAIHLAKCGRQEGFAALYERYARYLFTIAWRMLGNREAAEDALQETFSAAFRGIAEFQGRSRFKTWLYTILFRSSVRLREKQGIMATDTLANDDIPTPDTSNNLEQRLLVEQTLDRLPPRDRAVLIMAYWDDLSCKEIGEILGLKENHVKILLYRARARFGELWPEKPPSLQQAKIAGGHV